MTRAVDIRPDHLEIVQGILREHLPVGVKVWVFGSRASWTRKEFSVFQSTQGSTVLVGSQFACHLGRIAANRLRNPQTSLLWWIEDKVC